MEKRIYKNISFIKKIPLGPYKHYYSIKFSAFNIYRMPLEQAVNRYCPSFENDKADI